MKTINAVVDKNGKLLMLSTGKEVETKTVYKPWLAAALRDAGHKIVNTHADPRDPMKDCWDFEVDETFFDDLVKITNRKR